MSSGKKDYRTILPPKYFWISPLFPSPSQLCCRLLFPAPTALHPQFPLGPSSCGLAFYKIKYTPIIQSGNCLPWHLLPEVENAGPHKDMYVSVHSSSICDGPKWKYPKVSSFSKWINEVWYICIHTHYLAIKRTDLIKHAL